jgi:hypothetical protein
VQITLLWRGGPASGFGGAGHGYAAAERVAFLLAVPAARAGWSAAPGGHVLPHVGLVAPIARRDRRLRHAPLLSPRQTRLTGPMAHGHALGMLHL